MFQREAFGLKKGTIFVHDVENNICGSPAEGFLKLAWTDDGNYQSGHCDGTFILHADTRKDLKWFKECNSLKDKNKNN